MYLYPKPTKPVARMHRIWAAFELRSVSTEECSVRPAFQPSCVPMFTYVLVPVTCLKYGVEARSILLRRSVVILVHFYIISGVLGALSTSSGTPHK